MTDPVELTAELIRCPSVTPEEGGAIVAARVAARRRRASGRCGWTGAASPISTRAGAAKGRCSGSTATPTWCRRASTARWRHDPFGAVVEGGRIYGRGAADMKSGVAAFVAAAIDFVAATPPDGSVVLTVTGDEEGDGVDGTAAILDWMAQAGERMDHCIVGEPTSANRMGDTIKIGRRGSLTAYLTSYGVQGHSAYPERAKNPLPALVRLLDRLATRELDRGTAHFGPSTLAITTVDVGNPASNVIPAEARATVNIRFNDAHTPEALTGWIEEEADRVAKAFGVGIAARFQVSGVSFLTEPGRFTELVSGAVAARDRGDAGALDHGRNLGRALHQEPLSGGRARPRRHHDAPGGRACGGRPHPRAEGDLRGHPDALLRRSAGAQAGLLNLLATSEPPPDEEFPEIDDRCGGRSVTSVKKALSRAGFRCKSKD